jgi:hypothetical protein
MADYPRTRNGHVDDGTPLRSSAKVCPNCGSHAYTETISLEACNACGLRCDYWGGGTNAVYENMMQRNYAKIEAQQAARDQLDSWDE